MWTGEMGDGRWKRKQRKSGEREQGGDKRERAEETGASQLLREERGEERKKGWRQETNSQCAVCCEGREQKERA